MLGLGMQYRHWAREGTIGQELHLHVSPFFRIDAVVLVWEHICIEFLRKGRDLGPAEVFLSGEDKDQLKMLTEPTFVGVIQPLSYYDDVSKVFWFICSFEYGIVVLPFPFIGVCISKQFRN